MNAELFILRIPAILLALTIHEFAHGWMALKLGDPTARDAGRLTLNPVAHLDAIGALMLLWGPFGWAKPVPVNGYYFKKPKRDIFLVSAAGPLSNILLAFVLGSIHRILLTYSPALINSIPYLQQFLFLTILLNLGISFFNLLPIPPLDGSKILLSMLPDKWIPGYLEKTKHIPLIFMGLLIFDWVTNKPFFSKYIFMFFDPYQSFWMHLIYGKFF
ncbi:MAG: site-2 protease family protein [Fibrobacter sp.]|jgi:Zn-dependent protease|nr:site-2 protease family protein [Fibrobacter sp.]